MKEEEYLKGKTNLFIRVYFYLSNGMAVANEFRNVLLGIVALYIALKLANPLWMVGMFGVAIPVLTVIGYYNVHKMSKVKEWLTIKFSTHYGIQQFDYIKRQCELLEAINFKLEPKLSDKNIKAAIRKMRGLDKLIIKQHERKYSKKVSRRAKKV